MVPIPDIVNTGNMSAVVDPEQIESDAKITAAKHVANMLQIPDQLEKVDQYIRKVSRKKASVEALLKTAVQSQLDGVRSGLNMMQTALGDIKEIKQSLLEVDESFQSISDLNEKLKELREENAKHCQAAAAMENMKHIFTVPESVEKAQNWINDGKLLLAHQCLSDLENCRDELLFELHKLANQSPTDKNLLKRYFANVEDLSDSLGKQVWLVLNRTLTTVRKEPTVIATAMRIIEREERTDEYVLTREKQFGFCPPGRPKNWKKKCLQVLEQVVAERIEGNQLEDRTINKMWLVRHLEVTRILILEDLRVVKTVCVPCFPPSYNIVTTFVKMYHDCLSRHLHDLINDSLEDNEIITLLTWINAYTGPELMNHPELMIDMTSLGPLLDNETVDKLLKLYLDTTKNNIQQWMDNCVSQATRDWRGNSEPEADNEGFFHTSVPLIVFQMVDQILQVAKQINEEFTKDVLHLCLDQLYYFSQRYKDSILEYKHDHFENRNRIRYFTHYMIAIVNNCSLFLDLNQNMQRRYLQPEDVVGERKTKAFADALHKLNLETTCHLLEEMFLDLDAHVSNFMTKDWMTSSVPVDTICATIEDYSQDYVHLKGRNLAILLRESQQRILSEYVRAMLSKRLSFRNYEERKCAAEKMCQEADHLRNLFFRLSPGTDNNSTMWEMIATLAEVIKLMDTTVLSLEISGIVNKYPDVSSQQLVALLMQRGDLQQSEAKQMVSHIIPDDVDMHNKAGIKTIFSKIRF